MIILDILRNQPNNKVVFIDWGVYLHRAIFSWRNRQKIPATYTALSMLIGDLKRVALTPDDIVIIAVDSPKGSWRKEIDSNYKANRKKNREAHEDINWTEQFAKFDNLLINLNKSTPFFICKIDKLEADDIIAYGIKYFKDNENIIISSDTDYEQLASYPNLKLFSPISKKYKTVKNPHKILAKKIKKEAGDNLTSPILTEEDFEKRKMIVDLIHLPSEIEERVKNELDKLELKDFNLELLQFKSLRERFMTIYNPIEKSKKTKKLDKNQEVLL
jgi:5'-3' exonuclease